MVTGEIEIDPPPRESPPMFALGSPMPTSDIAEIERALALVNLPERPSSLEITVTNLEARQATTSRHVEILLTLVVLVLITVVVLVAVLAVRR